MDSTSIQQGFDKDLGDSAPILLNIWIYFNLISNNILLPILVLTILTSRQIRRHATFVNLCLTWIFSGIFSLLLFYAHQYKDSEPPQALCIAQSSLLFGIAPMWSIAVLAIFYYLYKSLQGQSSHTHFKAGIWWFMLVGPYFFQLVFSIAALVISLRHPDRVLRRNSFFYCGLHSVPLSIVRTIFVAMCTGCSVVIAVPTIRMHYHNLTLTRRALPVNARTAFFRSELSYMIRIFAFAAFVVLGMVIDFVALRSQRSVLPQIYVATAGAFIFLVFGSQADVLRVWFPCKLSWYKEPRRVSNRPYRKTECSRLHDHLVILDIGPQSDRRDDGRIHPECLSSRTPSFTLDDLFPARPEPARTAGVLLQYTDYTL